MIPVSLYGWCSTKPTEVGFCKGRKTDLLCVIYKYTGDIWCIICRVSYLMHHFALSGKNIVQCNSIQSKKSKQYCTFTLEPSWDHQEEHIVHHTGVCAFLFKMRRTECTVTLGLNNLQFLKIPHRHKILNCDINGALYLIFLAWSHSVIDAIKLYFHKRKFENRRCILKTMHKHIVVCYQQTKFQIVYCWSHISITYILLIKLFTQKMLKGIRCMFKYTCMFLFVLMSTYRRFSARLN